VRPCEPHLKHAGSDTAFGPRYFAGTVDKVPTIGRTVVESFSVGDQPLRFRSNARWRCPVQRVGAGVGATCWVVVTAWALRQGGVGATGQEARTALRQRLDVGTQSASGRSERRCLARYRPAEACGALARTSQEGPGRVWARRESRPEPHPSDDLGLE